LEFDIASEWANGQNEESDENGNIDRIKPKFGMINKKYKIK